MGSNNDRFLFLLNSKIPHLSTEILELQVPGTEREKYCNMLALFLVFFNANQFLIV